MKQQTSLFINGLSQYIAYCEAQGLAKCFEAYANDCPGEYIMEVGFNSHSGYVYIALEMDLSICSCMGNAVEYLVTDFMTGHEEFFDTYQEAIDHLNSRTH